MNYVTINGVKSNTVKGLLVQSLPPVSKPLMRTEIEQVDGRDGDIVTNLGYAAYDKELSIGLRGDFDIDDVIAFFDTSGTVTFSNEPDKYYNFTVVNQIDFEKLLRFRQATVTFHVQPFKYSVVGDEIDANRFGGLPNATVTDNGVTVNASGGTITISGTATAYTEIYLPINALTLAAGDYTLSLTATGTGAAACPTRLIGSVPSNADSFGGNYVALSNNAISSIDATLTASTTYNYLWFYVSPNVAIDITLDVYVLPSALTLYNMGNTFSRPAITMQASGTVNLYFNANLVLTLALGDDEFITVDAAEMNAYYNGVLLNRIVTGDYDNVTLQAGSNAVSWDGDIDSIVFSHVSRWI